MIESYNTSDLCFAGNGRKMHIKGQWPYKTLCHRVEGSPIREVGELLTVPITDERFCPSCVAIVNSWNSLAQTVIDMRKRMDSKIPKGHIEEGIDIVMDCQYTGKPEDYPDCMGECKIKVCTFTGEETE